VSGATLTIDTSIFHEGTRSLGIQLDSPNLLDAGVYEVVAVDPGTRYSLRASVHSEELDGANGLRIGAIDHYSNQVLYLSNPVIGSVPWQEIGGEFVVPAGTQLVRVCFVRSPGVGIIRGRIWFDDIQLEKR
jgi:hypothetical protein